MANKEIKDYDQVASSTLDDLLVCQQSGVTKKQTLSQVFSNVANLTAASTLDGTERIFIRAYGVNSYITSDDLADYILSAL